MSLVVVKVLSLNDVIYFSFLCIFFYLYFLCVSFKQIPFEFLLYVIFSEAFFYILCYFACSILSQSFVCFRVVLCLYLSSYLSNIFPECLFYSLFLFLLPLCSFIVLVLFCLCFVWMWFFVWMICQFLLLCLLFPRQQTTIWVWEFCLKEA